jgi:hypothetical protein
MNASSATDAEPQVSGTRGLMVLVGVAAIAFAALAAMDVNLEGAGVWTAVAAGPILGSAIGRSRATPGMEDTRTVIGAILGTLGGWFALALLLLCLGIVVEDLGLEEWLWLLELLVTAALLGTFLAVSVGFVVGLVMIGVFRLAGWPRRRVPTTAAAGQETGQEGPGVVQSGVSGLDSNPNTRNA